MAEGPQQLPSRHHTKALNNYLPAITHPSNHCHTYWLWPVNNPDPGHGTNVKVEEHPRESNPDLSRAKQMFYHMDIPLSPG